MTATKTATTAKQADPMAQPTEQLAARHAAALAEHEAKGVAMRAQFAAETTPQGRTELHTWPDGSQAVGVPPFPEKSPKERAAEAEALPMEARAERFVAPSMPRSGEADVVPSSGTPSDVFEAKVQQQLASDVMSGKAPTVVNPTSSSDKPELANTDGTVAGADLDPNPTPEELEAIARSIKPEGDLNVTDEQKEAAVLQVARETKGPIVDTEASKATAKSTKAK